MFTNIHYGDKSLNSDSQHFYLQSTKGTKTCHLKPLNTKKTMTHGVGNPGPGLRQTQTCGRVNPVNGIPIFCLSNTV